jgi:hypothetical protein
MRAFENALGLITEHSSLLSRLILCYQARALGRDEVIIELLKNHVATDRASEGLYVLLAAAINSGSLATAREILDSISEDLRDVEWIQRADAILALNSGNSSAEEKVARYLRIQPNNVQMILAQVRIWQRCGRDVEIREFLKQLILGDLEGVPEERIKVAALIIHYENPFRGLEYAYSVLMDNWDRPQAHLAYQSLIFLTENVKLTLPSAESVAENTVVCIVSEGGERRYRIERKRHAFFEDERLTPENDLAGLLIGKQPGERFVLHEQIGTKPVEVRWVKSVFLDALHCSLEQFNERFPYADGLLKFSIDAKAQDPFEDIRSITKAQAEVHQRMLREYQDKSLPLSFAAAFIGKNPIDTWGALPTANVPFQVCRGTYEERNEALRTIERNGRKGCMVDEITLSLIRRLGVEKAVIAVCGKIHTTQSLVDSIFFRAKEAELNIGKTRGVVAWLDGQLVYENLSEETLQRIADDRSEEASWVKRVAVVVPAIPKKEFSLDARKIVNIVGHVATDPAVAADGNDLLLLSDDMGYRKWAEITFNVRTVWLQPVLIVARNIGALAEDAYCEAINMLALSGHTYTSLDVTCLMYQARKDEFVLTHNLSLLIGVLGGPLADLRSNSSVMSAFIDEISECCIDNLSARKIISEVFHAFTKGRREDQRELLLLILKQIKLNGDVIKEYALSWLVGHSIGMPYFYDLLSYYKDTVKT